ncbi:MAG: FliG C-terminal domain-containing protein [Spirochaetales bacterium]
MIFNDKTGDKQESSAKKMRTHIDELMARDGLLKMTEKSDENKDDIARESIYRRVAKFLLIIGVNEAARILPHLPPEQTEKIIPELASVRNVSPDEASVILAEFQSLLTRSRQSGGLDTARAILEKAFGKERAQAMIEKSVPEPEGTPFAYLQDVDDEKLFFLLKDEGAPIQTLVLSRIKPVAAAGFIKRLDSDAKKEIVMRLAKMAPMSPDIVRRVDQAMHEKLLATDTDSGDMIDGRSALAAILKKMDIGCERDILFTLSEHDPDLGKDIRERLFTVDDFLEGDDHFIQAVLRPMSEKEIAFLIAAKSDAFRNKILINVSRGRGDIILEEEILAKPMQKKDVDNTTAAFFAVLRRGWEEGKFVIKGRDEDIYV